MTVEFLDSASSWSNALAIAFGVLAAISAAAAWYFGGLLGAAKDAELDRFKAASAAAIAGSDAKAEQAKEGTAQALADAALATKGAEEAKARTATTALEVEAQRERAAKAEMALLELQTAVVPRVMRPAELRTLAEDLAASPSKGTITIEATLGDGEAYSLGLQLRTVLNETGWKGLLEQPVRANGARLPVGVSLLIYTSLGADTSHGVAFERFLRKTSLEFSARNIPGEEGGRVVLVIGAKKNPIAPR